MQSDEELMNKARKMAEDKAGLVIHTVVYIAVNLFLIVVWWFTGGNAGAFPWFIFILFGWGIGLVANFVTVYRGNYSHYVESLTDKEYRRLKERRRTG
jgi:uncharacterized protein (DUF486 family)